MSERAPSVVKCIVLLCLIDAALRSVGLRRVLRYGAVGVSPRAMTDRKLIDATLRNILTATALYPGRSQCLEQSVAAWVLLRRRGCDVQLRIGVQPYPFAAHAWLELDGQPLTESIEAVSRFAVMPEMAG